MEQRSQILKQMHLTKNEREREVRVPWWDSGLTSLAISTTVFTFSNPYLPPPPDTLLPCGGTTCVLPHLPSPLTGTLASRQTCSSVGDF